MIKYKKYELKKIRILSVILGVIVIIFLILIIRACSLENKNQDRDFWTVEGNKIIDAQGNECQIKSMGFSNNFWERSKEVPTEHNNEDSYKELNKLGFNTVRFCMPYEWFEDDKNPYAYYDTAWEWLDKNVEWAKKYDIKIIFNMHIAQGGKFTYEEGLKLWKDKECQKRFCALWKAIARHYKDEDTVLGFDLLNEPYVTFNKSIEKSFEKWDSLAKKTINEIREIDTKHIIFLDSVYGAIDMNDGTYYYPNSETEGIPSVDDTNVVYQVHFYEPMDFTHQTEDSVKERGEIVYPDKKSTLTSENNTWKSEAGMTKNFDSKKINSWQYMETDLLCNDEKANNACFAIKLSNLGENSKIYIDDIVVKEYDSNKVYTKNVYKQKFDTNVEFSLSNYDENVNIKVRDNTLFIEGKTVENDILTEEKSISKFFEVKAGYYYQVCINIKIYDTSNNTSISPGMYFYKAYDTYNLDKEYMENCIDKYMEFSRTNNVPIFVGEFGVCSTTIENNLGGEKWVEDMINIMNDCGINYSYHAYHEENFGLHMDFLPINKSKANSILYDVFEENIDTK